jgi:hypothetical protein
MAKEPVLTFRLPHPEKFHCSACPDIGDQGSFTLDGRISDLIDAFREHVRKYHGEDFSQAAVRIVREATEKK